MTSPRDHTRGHRTTVRRRLESNLWCGPRAPRIAQQATTQAEILELVLESGFLAGLTMPWAQHAAREGIVFRRLVDEFLTAEVGLAYLRDDGSPILKSLRKFLIDTFQPLSPESEALERGGRQMTLF